MPAGGFGNLIALPFQSRPREIGNSVFVDDDFLPYEDQWAYLSQIDRLSRAELLSLVAEAAIAGQIFAVRLPSTEEDDEPWAALPSRRSNEPAIEGTLPELVEIVLGNQVYIDRSHIPPGLVNRIARLAAFQNPEFYSAQAMRSSTFGKPRVISCAELFSKHVALPRGCLDDLLRLLGDIGTKAKLRDERQEKRPLETRFLGELTAEQNKTAAALLKHETGVLAATTAFGKTVVAANMIAARGRTTLVLVHRRQLLEQWVARLQTFLDMDDSNLVRRDIMVGRRSRLASSILPSCKVWSGRASCRISSPITAMLPSMNAIISPPLASKPSRGRPKPDTCSGYLRR